MKHLLIIVFILILTISCDRLTNRDRDRCVCTEEYDPVCVERGSDQIVYDNACYALCDGFTTADFVTCVP